MYALDAAPVPQAFVNPTPFSYVSISKTLLLIGFTKFMLYFPSSNGWLNKSTIYFSSSLKSLDKATKCNTPNSNNVIINSLSLTVIACFI